MLFFVQTSRSGRRKPRKAAHVCRCLVLTSDAEFTAAPQLTLLTEPPVAFGEEEALLQKEPRGIRRAPPNEHQNALCHHSTCKCFYFLPGTWEHFSSPYYCTPDSSSLGIVSAVPCVNCPLQEGWNIDLEPTLAQGHGNPCPSLNKF